MKCIICDIREAENERTLECTVCDRDQWREATIGANKRFQRAEDTLKALHNLMGRYLLATEAVVNYPCNYQGLEDVLKCLLGREEKE